MNLYLMRHTQPAAGHPLDSTRALTPEGEKQAAAMAEWMRREIGRVDIVIASPFTRVMQTAEVMADALGSYVADTTGLRPDAEPGEAWKEIERLAQSAKDVLLVGHDPSLNKLMFWLMGLEGDETMIRLDWGALALMQVVKLNGKLMWLVTPDLVAREEENEVIEAARELLDSLKA